MPKTSAGLLVYRTVSDSVEVLLAHPGGPFWRNRDIGAWSIPKGEAKSDEELIVAAHREFKEEMGSSVLGPTISLGSVRQRGGKTVHAWAIRGDFDPVSLSSNTLTLEWPRGSGQQHTFPEVDRADWFGMREARQRIMSAQVPFLDRLMSQLQRA